MIIRAGLPIVGPKLGGATADEAKPSFDNRTPELSFWRRSKLAGTGLSPAPNRNSVVLLRGTGPRCVPAARPLGRNAGAVVLLPSCGGGIIIISSWLERTYLSPVRLAGLHSRRRCG